MSKNNIKIEDDICTMKIKYKDKIFSVLFSKSDLNRVDLFKWSMWPKNNKWNIKYFYVATKIKIDNKQKTFYLHHLIKGTPLTKKFVIDHINRNTLDNTNNNLRILSRSDNLFNTDYPLFGKYNTNNPVQP